jgi:anti-sigma regulatory factor (Ser/Thr protein kinase)
MPHQIDTLELVPNAHAVATAIQWLETIGKRESWSPKLSFALSLSLDEALANIQSYAFKDAKAAGIVPAISLRCSADKEQVRLEIIDNGCPYNPTTAAPPALATSLDEAKVGGHGLRLMRHYLSHFHYQRRDGCNHLTLIANIC